MNFRKIVLLLTLVFSCAINVVYASGKAEWSYTGVKGPDNWASLSADYVACSGKNQSPVNLSGFIEAELTPIQFNYQSGGTDIVNNGHTVQVNYSKGSEIKVDGLAFNLVQFHFHAPSENQIDGKSYPLEAHFVHADKKGNLAVVAVMFEEGVENRGLVQAWTSMPEKSGDRRSFAVNLNAEDFLPENHDYYRFNGSLTTPPCSEGVRWLVMKKSVAASAIQIEAFKEVMRHPNSRPIQEINARAILE